MASNITGSGGADLGVCIKDTAVIFTEQLLSLFYILSPLEHTKDNANDVPNYEVALFPVAGLLVVVEQIIRLIKKHPVSRFQDLIINTGSLLLFTLSRALLLGVVVIVFSWIHNNFRIVDLPLHS
ncbi:unnamed protein product, partial [Oppiella nova]